MNMVAKSGRVKLDGLWYWFTRRYSFGKLYHSLDAGKTYHATMREAYENGKAYTSLLLASPPIR